MLFAVKMICIVAMVTSSLISSDFFLLFFGHELGGGIVCGKAINNNESHSLFQLDTNIWISAHNIIRLCNSEHFNPKLRALICRDNILKEKEKKGKT